MTYNQFAIILGSIYDENLFCFRCKNPESETLCKICIQDLGMHHCNGCNGLYFNDETCSICNCDAEQLDDDPESEQLDDDELDDDDD